MASVYTDFATAQLAALSDMSQAPNLRQYGGNLHFLEVKKTAYTGATADPLYLVRLPKGAMLIPSLCSVDYGDPGDALTGTIGYIYDDGTGDPDAYAEVFALGGSAGTKTLSSAGTRGVAQLTPVKLADDAWIYVTWGTATNAASHSETWHIAYTLA